MILKSLFMSALWLGLIDLNNVNYLKDVSKELMPVPWNPTRWWDWCMSEDEKKGIEPIFTDKN